MGWRGISDQLGQIHTQHLNVFFLVFFLSFSKAWQADVYCKSVGKFVYHRIRQDNTRPVRQKLHQIYGAKIKLVLLDILDTLLFYILPLG